MSSSLMGALKHMSSPEQPDEEYQKPCPFCAGTGKVRDYPMGITPNGVGTSYTLEGLAGLDFTATMYGT